MSKEKLIDKTWSCLQKETGNRRSRRKLTIQEGGGEKEFKDVETNSPPG